MSSLEIDGSPCAEGDIETKLGLPLSQPPLRAPVLAQHTLAYLFSAAPGERAAYFRAVLDTQDIEDFRVAVAAVPPLLKTPAPPELSDLAAVERIPALAASAGRIRKAGTEAELEKAVLLNTSILLKSLRIVPSPERAGQVDQVEQELQRRQASAFPLTLLVRGAFTPWGGPPATFEGTVGTFITERAKVGA